MLQQNPDTTQAAPIEATITWPRGAFSAACTHLGNGDIEFQYESIDAINCAGVCTVYWSYSVVKLVCVKSWFLPDFIF